MRRLEEQAMSDKIYEVAPEWKRRAFLDDFPSLSDDIIAAVD